MKISGAQQPLVRRVWERNNLDSVSDFDWIFMWNIPGLT
jgi:hypothetical protein